MSKIQTYIFRLKNEDEITIAFERWSYKRFETCLNKMLELYNPDSPHSFVYYKQLCKVARIAAYKDDPRTGRDTLQVWSATVEEFKKLLEAAKVAA